MGPTRTALITGSTAGIGHAIALDLARRGYRIVLNYHKDDARAQSALQEVHDLGATALLVRADVTSPDEATAMVERAEHEAAVDLLVNNVGTFHFKPFLETTPQEWDTVLRSSLLAAVHCSRALLPHMRSRSAGHIVNVASLNAGVLRAKPMTLPYAIAKAGIVLLTRTLAATEGIHGIRVNAVSPGFVDGGAFPPKNLGHIPLGRLASGQEIAEAIAYLDSAAAAYVTGADLDIHGGAFL